MLGPGAFRPVATCFARGVGRSGANVYFELRMCEPRDPAAEDDLRPPLACNPCFVEEVIRTASPLLHLLQRLPQVNLIDAMPSSSHLASLRGMI